MNMKNILVGLFVLVCFAGCNKEDKELKRLQIENEKMKGVILKKQVETISATEQAEQIRILSQWGQLKKAYQRQYEMLHKFLEFLDLHNKTFTDIGKQSLSSVFVSLSIVEKMIEAVNPINAPEFFIDFQKEQDSLSKNLTNLITVIEEHPNLKAMQDYLDLRTQLEATENRVTVERMRLKDLK